MSFEEVILKDKLLKEMKKNEELRKENEVMKRKIERIGEVIAEEQ